MYSKLTGHNSYISYVCYNTQKLKLINNINDMTLQLHTQTKNNLKSCLIKIVTIH